MHLRDLAELRKGAQRWRRGLTRAAAARAEACGNNGQCKNGNDTLHVKRMLKCYPVVDANSGKRSPAWKPPRFPCRIQDALLAEINRSRNRRRGGRTRVRAASRKRQASQRGENGNDFCDFHVYWSVFVVNDSPIVDGIAYDKSIIFQCRGLAQGRGLASGNTRS